jgi:ANTAR domain/GAF domain
VSRALHALAAAVAALVEDHDLIGMLSQLTVDLVDARAGMAAGLMMVDGAGPLEVLAASSHQAREIDLYELQTGEGPCLDAFRAGRLVHEEGAERISARWPEFGPRLVDLGCLAVHASPMLWRGQTIGALNIFFPVPDPLDAEGVAMVQAFADVATIAVVQAGLPPVDLAGLTQDALQKRTVIEQAKGVIAVTHGVDVGAAFDLLRDRARNESRGLDVVARDVIQAAIRRTTSTN